MAVVGSDWYFMSCGNILKCKQGRWPSRLARDGAVALVQPTTGIQCQLLIILSPFSFPMIHRCYPV